MYRKTTSSLVGKYIEIVKISTQKIATNVPSLQTFHNNLLPMNACCCKHTFSQYRHIHSSSILRDNKKNPSEEEQALVTKNYFETAVEKSKDTYLDMVRIYMSRSDKHRRGHVEFIYAALRHMEEFGVNKDLEAYKSLIDILPKGRFIPQNIFQAEFLHYPKQQQCVIDVLEQMEDNGVIPDFEMEDLLINIFGKKGHPVRKFWRMMYWMPRFKNLSPWVVPNPPPDDALELAKIAMKRMSSVDLESKVQVYEASDLEDSLDNTWIVSAQSVVQKKLVQEHPKDMPVFVEGPSRVWLRNASVDYYILRADAKPRPEQPLVDGDDVGSLRIPFFHDDPSDEKSMIPAPSVHEQDDGTILAMCASGSSSRDSLLSWVRHLEADGNPALASIPVLFKLRSPPGDLVTRDAEEEAGKIDEK